MIAHWIRCHFALALHVAALVAFALGSPAEPLSGAGGQRLEAIEVTLVTSTVIAARETKPAEPTPAAKAEIAPEDGDYSQIDTRAAPPPEKPEPVEAAVAPIAADPFRQPEEAQPEPLPKEPDTAPPPEPQSRGGVAASASEGSSSGSGPVSASPGEMRKFAGEVRAALARNKPDGRGRHGMATISFIISAVGKVGMVRVTSSSGNPVLDRAARDAVERTRFPTPPPSISERDLTFVIPFRFQ